MDELAARLWEQAYFGETNTTFFLVMALVALPIGIITLRWYWSFRQRMIQDETAYGIYKGLYDRAGLYPVAMQPNAFQPGCLLSGIVVLVSILLIVLAGVALVAFSIFQTSPLL